MASNKIISIEELAKKVDSAKAEGKRVVHCHGVFDLLHFGHIKHFEEAKTLGDILIVTITSDNYVKKGPNRPAFSAVLRLQVLASLEAVDYVAENSWPTAVKTIKILQPDIYCKGPDYKNNSDDVTGNIDDEASAVISVGGEIRYTKDITFSSSSLLNKFGNVYNESQKAFIQKLLKGQNFEDIKAKVNELKKLKVLVLGETIIDQYVFCEALGKSGKEPVLVLRDLEMDQYAGGAAAIARHLSDFCENISLLSLLGEKKEFKDFVLESLPDNIEPYFIYKKASPTITKKRYVDYISKSKSLGVYSINDAQMDGENLDQLHAYLNDLIPKHDLMIVSDYGHGFISSKTAKHISKYSIFTSLNAQINAANIGYHTMDNYMNIDCAIINETELRHELRDRESDVKELMRHLVARIKAKNLVVTQGSGGATLYTEHNEKFHHCPAFATTVLDKIGAGDAMLALFSCSLKSGFDSDLSLFMGSLAAAQSVESIGNSTPVNKMQLLKTFIHAVK
jgi:rfaE bifunctional protein kinase chain/domain/rfaE bifunctional protein nucleotidyltransferase chain/domain|tara:strand:- start:8743 stop:10269 length:1527 start_codon:yes stop_codon:yes gene_type:complete